MFCYHAIDLISITDGGKECDYITDDYPPRIMIVVDKPEEVCVVAFQGQAGSLGIWADGTKCTEPWKCLTCPYSGWSDPHTPQAVCHTSRESQLHYILHVHKAGRVPRYCITKHDSVHVGPFKVIGILPIRPILKVMGMLLVLVAQKSG